MLGACPVLGLGNNIPPGYCWVSTPSLSAGKLLLAGKVPEPEVWLEFMGGDHFRAVGGLGIFELFENHFKDRSHKKGALRGEVIFVDIE